MTNNYFFGLTCALLSALSNTSHATNQHKKTTAAKKPQTHKKSPPKASPIKKYDYEAWKKDKHADWDRRKILTPEHRRYDLASQLSGHLHTLKTNYARAHDAKLIRDILYHYNFLRNYFHQPRAESIKQVNHSWVQKKYFELFKAFQKKHLEGKHARECQQNNTETDPLEGLSWKKNLPCLPASPAEQQNELILQINNLLEHKKLRYSERHELVDLYNYLLELRNSKKPTKTSKNLNRAWLSKTTRAVFKELVKAEWKKNHSTADECKLILCLLLSARDTQKKHLSEYQKTLMLVAYNMLRALYHLKGTSSASTIDKQWVRDRTLAISMGTVHKLLLHEPPSTAQSVMIHDAVESTGLPHDTIKASNLSHNSLLSHMTGLYMGGMSIRLLEKGHKTAYIKIDSSPDYDHQLFTIYHELGHIVNHDLPCIPSSSTLEEFQHVGIDFINEKINRPLQDAAFAHDVATIQSLIARGKTAFTSTNHIGKLINRILQKHSEFWVIPIDQQTANIVRTFRGQEQRADLFAIKTLCTQKKLGPILRWLQFLCATIEKAAKDGHEDAAIVAQSTDKHPSPFERLLCTAGFLIEQGIDLNGALETWEQHGVCVSVEDGYPQTKSSQTTVPPTLPGEDAFWMWAQSNH